MSNIIHLRALVDGHAGYEELLPGRIGSLMGENRPAFIFDKDKLNNVQLPQDIDADDNGWQQHIENAAASVGRIELQNHAGEFSVIATCFRVGSDCKRVATAAHVVEALLEQDSTLTPGTDPQPTSPLRNARVVFEATANQPEEIRDIDGIEVLHGVWDLMLCRLNRSSERNALALADHGALRKQEVPIGVIGYPVVASSLSTVEHTLFESLFEVDGEVITGVKRASPGLIKRLPEEISENIGLFRHDALTLHGSSGSPAISLETGDVLGLHYSGKAGGSKNRLVYLPAVCMDSALNERMSTLVTSPVQETLGPWAEAEDRIGDAFLDNVTVGDGEESAAGTSPWDFPHNFRDTPAVLRDRQDSRDRFYTPSLNKPRPDMPLEDDDAYLPQQQRAAGDCTGFALANAIDRQLKNQGRSVEGGVSARMLYEIGRQHDEFIDDQPGGSSLRGVIKGFYHNGVCPAEVERALPSGNWSLTVEMAKQARSISLGAYYRLRANLPDFQMAIQEAGAVIVSAWLHTGWRKPRQGRIKQSLSRKQPHAFVLVGYDDQGFIVQNSWGAAWGDFNGKPGYAHWSYPDWALNVIDAWVLQPAPSAPLAHNLPLRSYTAESEPIAGDLAPEIAALPEPRRMAIIGHIAHAERSGLIDAGRIGAGQHSLRETALYLSTKEVWQAAKYDSIAFIFHDPFVGAEAAARLSAHMIPRYKAAKVYPLNIVYGTDEVRSLTARMRDEAQFTKEISAGTGEDLTPYFERRATIVCKPLLDAYIDGLEKAAEPGGALWRIVASLCLEALHQPGKYDGRRKLHAVAFGAGALAAQATLCGKDGKGFFDDIEQAALPLDSVSLLAPLTVKRTGVGKESTQWPVADSSRLLNISLSSIKPENVVLPAYCGDWCDLVASMLSKGGYRPRQEGNRSIRNDRLVRLVTDSATLDKVMRNVLGSRRLRAQQRF